MGLLANNLNTILAGVSLPSNLLSPHDIERATALKSLLGGGVASFDAPEKVKSRVLFAIQSMRPAEIETWKQRGVSVSHKAYTSDPLSGVQLGDRIVDTRYTPTRYYVVQWVEDMAGAGALWAVFANLVL